MAFKLLCSKPTQLNIFINDVSIGTSTAPAAAGQWAQSSFSWNSSGNSTAIVKIIDLNTESNGNDFALDDISLVVASTDTIGGTAYADLANEYEFAVVVDSLQQNSPGISGNIVVWSEDVGGNTDIYAKNLLTGEVYPICDHPANQWNPAISGNYVVWVDDRNAGDWVDIYGKNLSTGQEFPICTASGIQQYVAISGDYVIYLDEQRVGLYGKRLSTGEEFLIDNGPSIAGIGPHFAIYGNKVIYRKRNINIPELHGKNIETGETFVICTNIHSVPAWPAIYENIVVWKDERNTPNPPDIYAADISDTQNVREFPICVGSWNKSGQIFTIILLSGMIIETIIILLTFTPKIS